MTRLVTVPSFTTADRYDVERADAATLVCACPSRKLPCKHVLLVRIALLHAATCRGAGHRSGGGGVCLQCLVDLMAAHARLLQPPRGKKRRRTDGR